MKNSALLLLSIFIIVSILGFSNNPYEQSAILNTREAKEIMRTIEKAYDIEAEATYSFNFEKFSDVFVNDPRFPLDPYTLEAVRELSNNSTLESAGWLDYKIALYSWRRDATLHAEAIYEKAKKEKRELTNDEKRSLVDSNGRSAPARSRSPKRNIQIIFISMQINDDIAIVVIDDGPYVAELTLVLLDGKWYIASFKGISVNV